MVLEPGAVSPVITEPGDHQKHIVGPEGLRRSRTEWGAQHFQRVWQVWMMTASKRKELVWSIKKGLLHLSADHIFQIATFQHHIIRIQLNWTNRMKDVCSYMSSTTLLELEDEGMSQLLCLKDVIDEMITCHTLCYLWKKSWMIQLLRHSQLNC